MPNRVWHVGDFVEIECHNGSIFHGVLQDITDDFIMLNGFGFANGVVKDIRLVPR